MIYEERDYRTRTGKLAYFTSEIGKLDHVVALWGHDSLDDRMARRKAMVACSPLR